ncbi:DUF7541 family protein [Halorhabdus rudnickae]|uniref:DUF7541 family protein n=1 Tax=Halorhabdus rudnickae TaxID=1775544 RepID=UPI0010834A87|nr:cox cluster protein [Halorhabdus rudnickae]
MSEQVDAGGYRRASPWPVFVALGFALSELGIFVGLYPVAVGGLLLLAGSVAGILRESNYATDVWRPLAGLGAVLSVLGLAIVATQIDPTTLDILAVVADPGGIVGRGLAVVGAGVILFAVGLPGLLLE